MPYPPAADAPVSGIGAWEMHVGPRNFSRLTNVSTRGCARERDGSADRPERSLTNEAIQNPAMPSNPSCLSPVATARGSSYGLYP